MDRWEIALEDLIKALKKSEKNLNEGRPPIREVVNRLMERASDEDLD
jgi:hypothetical protein